MKQTLSRSKFPLLYNMIELTVCVPSFLSLECFVCEMYDTGPGKSTLRYDTSYISNHGAFALLAPSDFVIRKSSARFSEFFPLM